MTPENLVDTDSILAQPEADPGSRRVLRWIVFWAFFVGFLVPFATDIGGDLRLQAAYSERLQVTIPPRPDRYRGFQHTTVSLQDLVKQAQKEQQEEKAASRPEDQPLTLWLRILYVWNKVDEWVHESPEKESSVQRAVYFWGLVGIFAFIIAAKIFGVNRVAAFVSGMIGADRIKKVIIDLFFLRGVEKTIFPSIKTALSRSNILASTNLNRLEVHDVIRVTVGVQGDGRVECWRESVTVEGRGAYT
ncbi:MAG: hypothetical protein HY814_13355 [Candidatus Riflebacteria bacterium]|nr:hypothetical protein [Candidatus Riflebacteria bacterium]